MTRSAVDALASELASVPKVAVEAAIASNLVRMRCAGGAFGGGATTDRGDADRGDAAPEVLCFRIVCMTGVRPDVAPATASVEPLLLLP